MGRKVSSFCVVLLISFFSNQTRNPLSGATSAIFCSLLRHHFQEVAMSDVQVSDAEVIALIISKRPDTWWFGWSRAEYENAYQELVVLKKKLVGSGTDNFVEDEGYPGSSTGYEW